MKKFTMISIALLTAGSAFAADKMAELDANQDGLVSMEEASVDQDISASFATLDANKDGYLTATELEDTSK